MQFLNHLDVNENQTKKQKLYLSTAAGYTPTGGEGNLIYDTSDDLLKYWDGSNWITLMNSSGGATYTTTVTDNAQFGVSTSNNVDVTLVGSNGVSSIVNFRGTAMEINVDSTVSNAVTISQPENVHIGNDLTVGNDCVVTGDLTVNGTTTTVNSSVVTIEDNLIVLNSNITGAPPTSTRSGLEIERGSSTNVFIQYNELSDAWEFTNDGTTFCNIPCSSTGTVLSYTKHYADDGTSVVPANAADNIKFVGGCGLETSTTGSSSSGSGFDEILIDHSQLTQATSTYGDYDFTANTVNLTHGQTFAATSDLYFDACGHRTKHQPTNYRLPLEPTTYPDQNIYERFKTENITTVGGSLVSGGGGIQTADTTQDMITFKGVDTSIYMDTTADDNLTVKAAVKCTFSDILSSNLVMDGGTARCTLNHSFGTDKLIVELWTVGGEKVEADVKQETFTGSASTNHITIFFSQIPSTDLMCVIHANNNDVKTTTQYS